MVKTASVADYIVERLATEGINHCFGIADDYMFPICDAVDGSAKPTSGGSPRGTII
jgi:indolepyruvate decarboxylase